jgi:hypothetical protein
MLKRNKKKKKKNFFDLKIETTPGRSIELISLKISFVESANFLTK